MSKRFKFITIAAIIAMLVLLTTILADIKNTYIKLGTLTTELSQVKAEFNQYHTLVQKVNEIDNKFTRNLADAKAENDHRYNNVINDVARLQLNNGKPNQTSSAGMDDANACELTGETRQNYYLLRDDIITKDTMILGLQQYISRICLAE